MTPGEDGDAPTKEDEPADEDGAMKPGDEEETKGKEEPAIEGTMSVESGDAGPCRGAACSASSGGAAERQDLREELQESQHAIDVLCLLSDVCGHGLIMFSHPPA